MSGNKYEEFLVALAERESGGEDDPNTPEDESYGSENPSHYLGKYQMGEAALVDAGYVVADSDTGDNDYGGGWTGKNNIYSKNDFLNDPLAQEEAVRNYHQGVWDQILFYHLDTYIGQTIGGVPITPTGLLAGAHLVGAGGVKQFLESGGTIVPEDGNHTPVSDYMDHFAGPDNPYNAYPIPLNKPETLGPPEPFGPWLPGTTTPFGQAESQTSPIVLDIDGSGTIELAALNGAGSVYWDIDQDGFREASGWITGGDGLLCVDLNSDGVINDHGELFGGTNGYTTLDGYDTNNDNTITSADTNFGNLLVWVDANANGFSESAELHTLSSLGITSIATTYSNVNYNIAGNHVSFQSTFVMNGNTYTSVDAFFAFDSANTVYTEDYTFDVRALFLPELRGYGDLPNLRASMSMDEGLLDLVQEFSELDVLQVLQSMSVARNVLIEDIMFRWAGVDGVDPSSRGGNIDARIVEFLEALVGQDFTNVTNGNHDPVPTAVPFLMAAWENAYDAIATRLAVQGAASVLFTGGIAYNPVTDTFDGTPDTQAIEDLSSNFDHQNLVGSVVFWENIFRVIDRVSGLANLDQGIIDDLDTIIQNDDLSGTLSYDTFLSAFVESNQTLYGDGNANILLGGAGIDTLYGYGGNDILIGHDNKDTLHGGTGDDTYVFNSGDGYNTNANNPDLVNENLSEGTDRIVFGPGIETSDIYMWTDTSGDLTINYDGAYDLIKVQGDKVGGSTPYATTVGSFVEQIVFDDSTTWDLTAGLHLKNNDTGRSLYGSNYGDTIEGGAGIDTLYGYGGNDILIGHDNKDTLYGGTGDDTYVFNPGDGYNTNANNPDLVNENLSEGTDRIVFGPGIETSDIYMWTDTSGDLTINYDGAYDLIKVQGDKVGGSTPFATTVGSYLEQIVFDDSTTWDLTAGLHLKNNDTGRSLYGSNYGDTIEGGAGNETLYGYDGADNLYAGAGGNTLVGGAGADTFTFKAATAFDSSDTISDFSTAQSDKIDISNLLSQYDPLTELISDFVKVTDNGTNSILYIDQDGGVDNYTQIATLSGVTNIAASSIATETELHLLITNGNLIVV